ncbi:MAG: SDR family oxidoreductase [Deltaproteobacteria bacterium]|jgi:NAD(P)-dependent dehydrogenase (short-subunit alcohol dehydrogenase family)|nr:SDR family oxidoreductase [Deltaproteobacteria bacterium]
MSTTGFDLKGKRALICGASGGIGQACARLLAQTGARLFISGTQDAKLGPLSAELSGLGAQCAPLAMNLTEEGEPERLVAAAEAEMGGLDILVNAMGINRPQPALEVTGENWDAVLDINLRSLFFACQAAGRRMVAQGYGRIVNISSQTGTVAIPLRAAYCASKAGVDQLTKELALEWAPKGVTVNAVAPTFVETPFVVEMFKDPDFKKFVLDSIPVGRMATPEEIAHAVLYLASDQAAIVTGHVLLVDGGWTIK